jgi:predicted aldo/keto reductase-like oxidoreductase
MSIKEEYSRRDFLKIASAASVGSIFAPASTMANVVAESPSMNLEQPLLPKRPFGKTGVNVSMLALGGYFNALNNQPLLKQAIRLGVTYWETSYSLSAGIEGYGYYFKSNPADRENVFLSAKTDAKDPKKIEQNLDDTLRILHTSYIDFFMIHAVNNIDCLNSEIKSWVEQAKAKNKVRFFGFSTHANMEECMIRASKLSWIDGIMTSYNYRLMYTDQMKGAAEACAKAGIALTAFKSQAVMLNPSGTIGIESETALKLTDPFLKKGFTLQQAKLKAIWENPYVSSICSLMPNMTILLSNVAAALDRREL